MQPGSHDEGSRPSLPQLFEGIYERLRELSGAFMRHQPQGHTLQSTAVVHEAFLKLADRSPTDFVDQDHFMATAATVLRSVLIDHARRRGSRKRGGGGKRFSVDDRDVIATPGGVQGVLELEDSLRRLNESDARAAKVAELRIFGGMQVEAIARVLGTSVPTVNRDWRFAKAYLEKEYGLSKNAASNDAGEEVAP
jgi:RNA polymerase sigma factor (TIGR02999 family)